MTFSSTPRRVMLASLASAALLAACSNMPNGPQAKGYSVDTSRSSLSFVTTKAGAAGVGGISETMRFTRYSGGMDAAGKVTLTIDLASVDSGVEIRDERMRTMLWNVKATPQASFTAQLPQDMLNKVNSGSQNMEVAGQLQLAGQSKPITTNLTVTNAGNGLILVSTRQPIVVNSNDYGLRSGVEALREVMGLNFLASSAPVSLNLMLKAI